ncbi:hypothetical protein HDG34_000102 [Paraburkholderia sp. HC6.4b]|uniref:hypothetical protein n=1 Tax=unclassified Paraburkholderia TaxID=2615204 RepID=UPI00161AD0CF|nr:MULTISPECIES: hypothetical protein [unclassified Paraburkholderia]MBB5406187.1 hypothetical protein [Paraburkholderia sp. HC6.4b]MBB5448583.1 hypothetical protein [Paraburkholderia sp. Kb1A]
MKAIFRILLLALVVVGSTAAFSKALDADAYQICMNRTKHDRLNCQAGCGMIIQQCYDEGVADINKKIDILISDIKSKNGAACSALATNYLSEASRMEGGVENKANNLIGWVGSELTLNFARQRLDNLGIIMGTCKQ